MQRHVAVGMRDHAVRVRNPHAAEHHVIALAEGMHVVTDPHPHRTPLVVVSPAYCRRMASASAASCGIGHLDVVGAPGAPAAAAGPGSRSPTLRRSPRGPARCRAAARARSRPKRNICGVRRATGPPAARSPARGRWRPRASACRRRAQPAGRRPDRRPAASTAGRGPRRAGRAAPRRAPAPSRCRWHRPDSASSPFATDSSRRAPPRQWRTRGSSRLGQVAPAAIAGRQRDDDAVDARARRAAPTVSTTARDGRARRVLLGESRRRSGCPARPRARSPSAGPPVTGMSAWAVLWPVAGAAGIGAASASAARAARPGRRSRWLRSCRGRCAPAPRSPGGRP